MSNKDTEREIDFDSWLQFATLILNRSTQHIAAMDNRIYYVLAGDTALLVLLSGGIIAFLDKLPILFSIALLFPIALGGFSLWFGIKGFRPKVSPKLFSDEQRPRDLHMLSTDIGKHTREEYVKSLLELDSEDVKNEITQYIYDLEILLKTKSKLFDRAMVFFKWALITGSLCVVLVMLIRGFHG